MALIPVRGNWLGLIMFVLSAIVALIGGFFLKAGNAPTMIAVGTALFLMDMIFRLLTRNEKNWLFGKQSGGYFFFVPVWLLGIIVVIINIVNASGFMK